MEPLTNCYPYISPIFELAVISNESLVRQPITSGSGRGQLPPEVWHARRQSSHQFHPLKTPVVYNGGSPVTALTIEG